MELEKMTDQELGDLVQAAQEELGRRQTVQAINDEVAHVLKVARRDGVTPDPETGAEWVQPTSAFDSYVEGDIVTHNSKTWVSTVTPNTWAPGISGWREQTADGSPAEYVQPSGIHDAYNTGELVTFEGDVYKALQDGLVWSPADYPQGWEKE